MPDFKTLIARNQSNNRFRSSSMLHHCAANLGLPLVFFIAILLHGCVSTRYTGTTHCPPYLKDGDKILLGAFSSANREYQIGLIRKQLDERNVKVLYAPEEEFNLRAAGVINPLDSASYPLMMKKGITHLLLIREADAKEGDLWIYRTPYELSLELNPYYSYNIPENKYSAEIVMQLLSLKTRQYYSFKTKTQVNGVNINDRNGGQNNVNAGSLNKARNIAIKKATARIAENCQ